MIKPLAIIQMGEPPQAVLSEVGEQSDWFIEALSLDKSDYRIYRPDLYDKIPSPDSFSGALITGSWAMVTDLNDWSEDTANWIKLAYQKKLPLFGVCYGHQLIAHALGGKIADNPAGVERGLELIATTQEVKDEPLLKQLPDRFSAWLSHEQSIIEIPEGAKILAFSSKDRCQMIRYNHTTFSVQFHPEFSLAVMISCLKYNNSITHLPDNNHTPVWPIIILKRFIEFYCVEAEDSVTH